LTELTETSHSNAKCH